MPRDGHKTGFSIETKLPDLVVQGANLPATAKELGCLLAASGRLFDRGGVLVLLREPAEGGLPVAQRLTAHAVVTLAHDLCEPVRYNKDGQRFGVTLPQRVALLYLDLPDWKVRPLAGITSAPLLQDDGGIVSCDGYDSRLAVWCTHVPRLAVPDHPSKVEAEAALALLRKTFRTFPFKESPLIACDGIDVVDITQPAGLAEASFMAGLMTSVCRPSLWTAPGLLITAPDVTGAGAGKGLLFRSKCAIAYGIHPSPFTAGHDRNELDKRLVAELIEAGPVTFLDNVNGTVLKSDTLASVMTERPARVRVMGLSQMVPLNCASLICLTGNGLSVSEDLARRFLSIELAPPCEDAESRPFPGGFIDSIMARRAELLSAVLTIWRWGRQNNLAAGLPLAGYEQWARWCRDPLIALGCADPVARVRQAKQADPKRRALAELFTRWAKAHGSTPVTIAEIADDVAAVLDSQQKGRQYRASRLHSMVGTRMAGYVLTREAATGKWGASTYALMPTVDDVPQPAGTCPMPPMTPMRAPAERADDWRGEL